MDKQPNSLSIQYHYHRDIALLGFYINVNYPILVYKLKLTLQFDLYVYLED